MVGRTPSPPRAVPPPVPCAPLTWGTQHLSGAGARPGLRYSRWGGLPPTPPAPGRGFCNAVGVVMHGAHRSPGPLQWQHRAGPLLAGSEGPHRAGLPCSAPLRSAPRWRDRASLPACLTRRGLPGARERGPDARTPHSPPSPLLAPRSAAWKCRCSARSVGKGEQRSRGCQQRAS